MPPNRPRGGAAADPVERLPRGDPKNGVNSSGDRPGPPAAIFRSGEMCPNIAGPSHRSTEPRDHHAWQAFQTSGESPPREPSKATMASGSALEPALPGVAPRGLLLRKAPRFVRRCRSFGPAVLFRDGALAVLRPRHRSRSSRMACKSSAPPLRDVVTALAVAAATAPPHSLFRRYAALPGVGSEDAVGWFQIRWWQRNDPIRQV
jgi:hypothetical protein